MATKTMTITETTSDISGQPADETITYAVEGTEYQIDLTKDEAQEFKTYLDRFNSAGRVLKKAKAAGHYKGKSARQKEVKAIREWAATKGIELNPQGRIPVEVRQQYAQETGTTTSSK